MPLDNVTGMTEQQLKDKGYWISQWDGRVKGGCGGDVSSATGNTFSMENGTAKPTPPPTDNR